MKTSYIVIGIILVIVVTGGMLVLRSNNNSQVPSLGEEENMTPSMEDQPQQSSLMVMYSDEGYVPGELKVKKGEIVTFMNKSSQPMWTASAIHPTHEVYPETSIQKCNSVPMREMFDACAGVLAGESWTFQFNEAGEWGYHNHLRPSHWGKVIVE